MDSGDVRKSASNHDANADSDCVCDSVGNTPDTVALVMARGYAAVLVILAVGFVSFILMISYLGFMHPDKGTQFLNNFAAPALALMGAYALKSGHEYFSQIGKK